MLWEVTKQIEGHTICALGDAAAWPVQVWSCSSIPTHALFSRRAARCKPVFSCCELICFRSHTFRCLLVNAGPLKRLWEREIGAHWMHVLGEYCVGEYCMMLHTYSVLEDWA